MVSHTQAFVLGICTTFCFVLLHLEIQPIYEKAVRKTVISRSGDVNSKPSIRPGELPGYTGWSRPERTMAPYYKLLQYTDKVQVGDEWRATLSCIEDECNQGGAHFYVRLYGPAVISGDVKDYHNGTYVIRSWPMDPGQYTVEVVMAFSEAPDWNDFPLPIDWAEPDYEGYILPDFPLHVSVEGFSQRRSVVNRFCSLEELTESFDDPSARIKESRWTVIDKIAHPSHRPIVEIPQGMKRVSLRGYQEGINSLGIWMEYLWQSCSLLPWPGSYDEGETNCLLESINTTSPLHIIFVGDSVMELQKKVFDSRIAKGSVKTSLVTTCTGIVRKFQDVKAELNTAARRNPMQRRLVLFNTGLHDISQLCNRKWRDKRQLYMNVSEEVFSCTAEYRRQLKMLVEFLANYPAEFRAFQSTTAGWPKYGNWGFGWSPRESQPFPSSPNFVQHMNEIAFDVVRKHNNQSSQKSKIRIMDGYWITLARPDNREVNSDNFIGKHMVHPGKEVVRAMVRIWWMIALYAISSECLVDGEV